MIARNETHSCEHCQVEYFCSRLKTIMAIVQSAVEESTDADIIRELDRINRELADAGFKYPHGQVACSYAADPERIQDITNRLIDLSRRIKRNSAEAQTAARGYYNEEVHCE